MSFVKRITLDLNIDILNEFYKISKILDQDYRKNCFYNKSSAFQYILKNFNQEVKNNSFNHNIINNYYTMQKQLKKEKEVGICINNYIYNEFIKNCNKLNIKQRSCIRILMIKSINDFNSKYKTA